MALFFMILLIQYIIIIIFIIVFIASVDDLNWHFWKIWIKCY